MASFATLPLMDVSRDSRIQDWIAEQYSFALSEFQDDHPWRADPPSLRESKLLPDNFDLITCSPPPTQRDTDSDFDSHSTHSYDPPLLPSPLSLLHDTPSLNPAPQADTDVEDALDGLLREMNSWRFAPASRSAYTLTLSDRNKVCIIPFNRFIVPLVYARHPGASSPTITTSHPHIGELPLPTSDHSIITHVFHFSRYSHVFFPTPPSALEGHGPMPLHRRV